MDGVVLLGNPPMIHSGYGSQLRLLGQKLISEGYAVAHICDVGYAGHMFNLNGVDVYGCDELPGVLTSTTVKNYIRDWRKRHRIQNWCLIGLGNVHNWGELVGDVKNSMLMVPVDGDSLGTHEATALHSASRIAAISRHGGEVIHEIFPSPDYLPHGYDLSILPDKSHRALRANATFSRADNCFLVGFLGDMSIRKCPQENLEAFSIFCQGKNDVRLWIKGSDHYQAEDVGHILELLPPGVVLSSSKHDVKRGLSPKEMGELLGGLDVLLHCSSQEGFGIFQVEAQAVGTPVINTAFGAMKELNACGDLMVVPEKMRNNLGVNYPIPPVEQIVIRLEALYEEWKEGMHDERRKVCFDWAKSWSFDAVYDEYYKGVIDSLMLNSYRNRDLPQLSVDKPRSMKRVAFLSTYDTNCGIATYTKMLAESLAGLGLEIYILAECTEQKPIGEYDLAGSVKVLHCWDRNYDAAGSLQEAIEQVKPDVIHVQHEWALFRWARQLWEALRKSESRVVFTYHTPDFVSDSHEGAWSHLLAHSSFADAVVTHNEFVARSIRGRIFPPVAHIHHGIKSHVYAEDARKSTKIPDGVPMLLNYGFASESKGTLDFVKALQIVQSRNMCPYFEAVIYAGDHPHWDVDPYIKECESIALATPGVNFIREFVPDDKLDLMLCATDFVVYPYSGVPGHEILSTSGAVMRGLGAGKPLICTDEGRLRDIIGGIHGFKSSMRDPESLAMSIQRAVNIFHSDKSTYEEMSRQVKLLASERNWQTVSLKHLDLYRKVCSVWSVRPDRVMPVSPLWIDNDARDMLGYEHTESSEHEEEE